MDVDGHAKQARYRHDQLTAQALDGFHFCSLAVALSFGARFVVRAVFLSSETCGFGGVASIRFNTSSRRFSSSELFDMENPWDAPLLPTSGDSDIEATFAGIGRVINMWETIEFDLSLLHSAMANDFCGDSMRDYGAGRIFVDRLAILSRQAEAFFISRCDQHLEGEFHALIRDVRAFSPRRHDIGHGIVFDISKIGFFQEHLVDVESRQHWAVIAPFYAVSHHAETGLPRFAYTSETMRDLALKFWHLTRQVRSFRELCFPGLVPP